VSHAAADAALILVAADAAFLLRRAFLDMAAAYRPRRELQKAAPRNFDAFFLRRGKKKHRISCGAVPRKRVPLLQCAASAGR
jgi:hypothetical protein